MVVNLSIVLLPAICSEHWNVKSTANRRISVATAIPGLSPFAHMQMWLAQKISRDTLLLLHLLFIVVRRDSIVDASRDSEGCFSPSGQVRMTPYLSIGRFKMPK